MIPVASVVCGNMECKEVSLNTQFQSFIENYRSAYEYFNPQQKNSMLLLT